MDQNVLVTLCVHRMMLDNGTVWRQVLCEPTADNPVAPEWHWDGYSALDDSKGPFLNDVRGVLGVLGQPNLSFVIARNLSKFFPP